VPQVTQQHFRREATKGNSDCCLGTITELRITIWKQEWRSKIFRKHLLEFISCKNFSRLLSFL